MAAHSGRGDRLKTHPPITDASSRHRTALPIARDDWTLLLAGRDNVLVEGPPALMEALLARWTAHLEAPVYWPTTTSITPPPAARTVVLNNVAELGAEEQAALLRLIADADPPLRFVSLSSRHLYDLVCQGRFRSDLYYRLNTIYLPL